MLAWVRHLYKRLATAKCYHELGVATIGWLDLYDCHLGMPGTAVSRH